MDEDTKTAKTPTAPALEEDGLDLLGIEEDEEEDEEGNFISLKTILRRILVKNNDDTLDKDFQNCFLMVYRSFIPPKQLLEAIKEAYPSTSLLLLSLYLFTCVVLHPMHTYDIKEQSAPAGIEDFSQWKMSLQAHLKTVFKTWVDEYPEDLKTLRKQVDEFIAPWRTKQRQEIEEAVFYLLTHVLHILNIRAARCQSL